MPWITMIEPEDASGQLQDLYQQIQTPDGHVDNIMKIHSLRPPTMLAHLSLYKAALHDQPHALSLRERELVGICVSQLNKSRY